MTTSSITKVSNRPSFARRFAAALLALAIGCVMAAALLEVLIRILMPQEPVARWFQEDDVYCYRLKRNFHQRFPFVGSDFVMDVQTNSLGLRDREIDLSASFNGKTLLLLGDSFVFGYGVNTPERFDAVLSRLLTDSGQSFRLINTGVPGWGTIQETTFARDYFSLFHPDIILLVFCGNDPLDDTSFVNKTVVFKETGLFHFPGKGFLRAHSHLYRGLLSQTKVLRHSLYLRMKRKGAEPVHVDPQSANAISESDWKRSMETIRSFHRDFLAFNSSGVLLLLATSPEDADVRNHLRSLDNGSNLLFVDLYDDVVRLPQEARELPYDRHWSVLMHGLVARAIQKTLAGLTTNNDTGASVKIQ